VEDAPGAAPPGEQLHLIGDARAGGVDQPDDRQLLAECGLGGPDDLFDRAGAPRACLDRRVVGDDDHRATVDVADAGDHAVGG
jgi:hypothetical protein